MTYQKITTQLLDLISQATEIIDNLHSDVDLLKKDEVKTVDIIKKYKTIRENWYVSCQKILLTNDLLLEHQDFINYSGSSSFIFGLDPYLNNIYNYLRDRQALLINFAKDLEKKQNKYVQFLYIDDFDNFKNIKQVTSLEVTTFAKDCFLEDDIEEAFLKELGEPYKELDSGAETRDLFTDKLVFDGKRLATVIMFKGRGVKGELTIDKCGLKGNQLLKLAKNNSAECFILQYTNKINPDVREALQDHILQNTRLSKVYICFVDGSDTARLLKSLGKDLSELQIKKRDSIKPS